MKVPAVLCALETQKATLTWERRTPLVSALLEVCVLFIRPRRGNTKAALTNCLVGKERGREECMRQGSVPCTNSQRKTVLQPKHLQPHHREHKPQTTSDASNCLQPTSLTPFPQKDEGNNGIMQVPALWKKLLRRDLAAAFLAHLDLLILSGILTHQRCDGGQQDIILDGFL